MFQAPINLEKMKKVDFKKSLKKKKTLRSQVPNKKYSVKYLKKQDVRIFQKLK